MTQGIRFMRVMHLMAAFVAVALLWVSGCTKDAVSTDGYIDAAGGQLQSEDGTFNAEIPRGALTDPVKFSLSSEEALVSPQISPTWRINPGMQLDEDYRATVFFRLSDYDTEGMDLLADLVPVMVQGGEYTPLGPVELITGNTVIRFKSNILTGYALMDWGCSKLCRKQSLCETGNEPEERELAACAEQCHSNLGDWRQNWCIISATCEKAICCTNPDAPVCGADGDLDEEEADGDVEPDSEDVTEDEEEMTDGDDDGDMDMEPETDPEPEVDPEPDIERTWPEPRRCFASDQCEEGETCYVPANLCFEIPEVNVSRYVDVGGNLISVSGDPDVSCHDKPFIPTEGPTNTRITVRTTVLGFASGAEGITVEIFRQGDWFANPGMDPLFTGTTDANGHVLMDLVPTNEKLVFRTRRASDDNNVHLVPGNNVDIIIPADEAQQAPPTTGVLIDVFAASLRTYEGYPQIAGYSGTIPADGGIIWTVLKDCQGYSINTAVAEMWDMAAPAKMYLSRNLEPQTSFNHTDAAGHTIFFDIPYGPWEIRFIGRTDRAGGDPEFLVRWDEQPTVEPPVLGHIIPAIPGEIVFSELNRWGWELPADN